MRPTNDTLVKTVPESPVLEREGIYAAEAKGEQREPITTKTWVAARQAHIFSKQQQERYRQLVDSDANEGTEKKELETEVAGIKVKYWN